MCSGLFRDASLPRSDLGFGVCAFCMRAWLGPRGARAASMRLHSRNAHLFLMCTCAPRHMQSCGDRWPTSQGSLASTLVVDSCHRRSGAPTPLVPTISYRRPLLRTCALAHLSTCAHASLL